MNEKKIKVIFINSLSGGGAERVAINLFKALKFDYILILEPLKKIFYDFPLEKVHSLNSHSAENIFKKFFNFLIRYFKIKKYKRKNKISLCLSLLEPSNLLNVLTKDKEKVIISFHSHYTTTFQEDPFFGKGLTRKIIDKIYRLAIKKIYNKADLAITVSESAKIDLIKNFGFEKNKIKTIYNPIYFDEIREKIKEDLQKNNLIFKNPVVITIGRLTKQKGHWYLLRIFKELKKEFSNLKLVILGEGELKDYLVNLSQELGLKTFVWDRDKISENFDVYFLGFQKNPFKFLAKSTLFVFPSLWEGFPNVLLEALACGVPVISSDCKSGPREILAPNTDFDFQTKEPEFAKYGILMPVFKSKFKNAHEILDETERIWIEVLKNILNDENLRISYSKIAIERAKYFDISKIIKEWEKVLEENESRKIYSY